MIVHMKTVMGNIKIVLFLNITPFYVSVTI
jgi:hypothetical protein